MSEPDIVWKVRFRLELARRGEQARAEMLQESPDWLREILGEPPQFGEQPNDCTCAKWYMDGTHHRECLHVLRAHKATPPAPG